MKINFLICFLTLSSIINAQTFERIGPRSYNSDNWDVSLSVNLYFDSEGTLYNYISEASQPRSNELVRYDAATDTWINLTNNSFSVLGGSGNTGGVPMADGSIFTITKAFGSNPQHYAYTILSNGTATPLSAHPLPGGDNAGIRIFSVQAPNGDIYYSHSVVNVSVGKWNGTQWSELPNVTSNVLGNPSSGMGIDENGDIYVVYSDPGTNNNARLVVFDEANNTWDQLFSSSETGLNETGVYVVSSTEVYIYYASANNLYVTRFDGTNFTSLGNSVPIENTFSRPGAMIKSQATGDVYLAGYRDDGNGFYKYNETTNNWDIVPNDIVGGGLIVGFHPTLVEKDACIYISGNDNNGITTVKYCPVVSDTQQSPNATENASFRLSPNPTNEVLNIQFDENTSTNIQLNIIDIMGKIIHTETRTISDSNLLLNVNDLNSGIYFIQIISNKKIMTKKFVVE